MHHLNIALSPRNRGALNCAILRSKTLLQSDTIYTYHNLRHAFMVASTAKFFAHTYHGVTQDAVNIICYLGLCHDIAYRGSSAWLRTLDDPYMYHPPIISNAVNRDSDTPAETASATAATLLLQESSFTDEALMARITDAIELTCIGERNANARKNWRDTDPLAVCLMSADLYSSSSSVFSLIKETLELSKEHDQQAIAERLIPFWKAYDEVGLQLIATRELAVACHGFFEYVVGCDTERNDAGHPMLANAARATYDTIREIAARPQDYVTIIQSYDQSIGISAYR